MAKRTSSVERSPAKLSYEKMKLAFIKIDRRLDEIKSLDIQTKGESSEKYSHPKKHAYNISTIKILIKKFLMLIIFISFKINLSLN